MTKRRAAHALLALAVVLAGAACAHAPHAEAAKADGAAAAAPQLGDVFGRVTAARAAGRPAIAIFGLDGTLVDPAARDREIFSLAFDGPDPVVNPPRPDLSTAIRALPLSEHESDPAATLAKIGVTDSAFVRAVLTRWNQDSHSNRFLTRDEPVPGAVGFVDSLYARGCTVVYLSGRDARRMLAGTAQSLFERGFPVGAPRTMLVLRPERTTPDSAYAARALDDLAAYGVVVAVFESEPARVHRLHERFPEALAFRIDTRRAATSPAPGPGVASMNDFTGFRIP
jgi:beta-phosphoglucomutase-like phosphatase (HAD superfamily)